MDGDARSCVERLLREYGRALEAFLYRRTGNHADAIELSQETWVRMLQIKDPAGIRDLRAYVFSVAANLAAEHGARQSRARGMVDISDAEVEAELAQDPDVAEQIDAAEFAAQLLAALAELPARCRAVYWFAYEYGMTYEEIARQLGVSRETVKKDLQRALRHIRERMGRR